MKKSKRLFPFLTAVLLLVLTSCSAKPLPDGMDEETVGQAARDVVAQLNAGEFQAVADAFRPDLTEEYGVTAEAIQRIMETVAGAGAFRNVERTLAVGGTNKEFGEPYAAAAVYCEHENKDVIYELSFDLELNLIGLQVKAK